MSPAEKVTIEQEAKYHHYSGNRIPWFVHVLWVAFWCFVAYYLVQYFVPAVQLEMHTRP
jgi:hypothetical protein